MLKKQTGFTIVELLIVIVVIGILAAITIVAYRGMQQRATTAAITSAVDQWEKIVRMELAVSGSLPSTAGYGNSDIICLGSGSDNFPAVGTTFNAGECYRGSVGNSFSYNPDYFATWKTQPTLPASAIPRSTLTFAGNTYDSRGIMLGVYLPHSTLEYARLQWVPQVAGQCGRGVNAISSEDVLLGGVCQLEIRF